MNADLERTLDEAGDDLRTFAERLRSAPQAHLPPEFTDAVMARIRAERMPRRVSFLRRAYPIAAAVAVLLALGAVVLRPSGERGNSGSAGTDLAACQRADGTFSASSAADYVQAFAVAALVRDARAPKGALPAAVGALVRAQGVDGGWKNARLSAYNVLALREASAVGVKGARTAYRRGLRYLHAHGIGEVGRDDLVREAKTAIARLGRDADPGLVRSAAVCAAL